MMSRLDRYIAVHILGAFAVVLLVVIGLMGISMLLDEIGEISAHYRFADALYYVLLSLPAIIYELLPMSALVGTLVGLGILASSSELTVMRATGLSIFRLLLAVLKPIILVALCALVISELGVPQAQQKAQGYKVAKLSAEPAFHVRGGAWYREADRFIHISAISSDGELLGLVEHRINEKNHRLLETLTAERAIYAGDEWILQQAEHINFQEDETALQITRVNERSWSTELTPELLSVILVDPMDLPISGLSTYANYLNEQGVNPKRYTLAYWNKLLQPLSVVALVLIGVAFVFGPLRSVTVGQRILTGIIVGLAFKFSQDLLAPASQVLGFAAFWAALIPILASLLFAFVMLSRVR